jgi:hypothetical protein
MWWSCTPCVLAWYLTRESKVCKSDDACNAMIPGAEGGVCYHGGIAVKENYQMCDVTNEGIVKQLKEKKPQVTFSCNAEREECTFQCRASCTLASLVTG